MFLAVLQTTLPNRAEVTILVRGHVEGLSMRKSWVQINGELVEKGSYVPEPRDSHYVIPDIKPYQSMVDGKMITSRSAHRDHLRAHGLIEVGNETKHLKTRPMYDGSGLKDALVRVVNDKWRR